MDNADVARAQTSLETYDQIIRNYWERRHWDAYRPYIGTLVRQRDLKRREMGRRRS